MTSIRTKKNCMFGGVAVSDDFAQSQSHTAVVSVEVALKKHFIPHSNCTLFKSNTSGGLLFSLNLRGDKTSPFYLNRLGQVKAPLRTILAKVVLLCDTSTSETVREHKINFIKARPYELVKEMQMQAKVYKDSTDETLDPICPAMIWAQAKPVGRAQLRDLLNIQENSEHDLLLKELEAATKTTYPIDGRYQVLYQEYMHGFKTVYEMLQTAETQADKIMVMATGAYVLTRLTRIGISHGDPHMSNVLMNESKGEKDMYHRAIVIDFGRSKSISPTIPLPNDFIPCLKMQLQHVLSEFRSHFSYNWFRILTEKQNVPITIVTMQRQWYSEKFRQLHVRFMQLRSAHTRTPVPQRRSSGEHTTATDSSPSLKRRREGGGYITLDHARFSLQRQHAWHDELVASAALAIEEDTLSRQRKTKKRRNAAHKKTKGHRGK